MNELAKYTLLAVRWAYLEGYHNLERYNKIDYHIAVEKAHTGRERFYKMIEKEMLKNDK